MADLIPIGTTTRVPSENNPVRTPEQVQETTPYKALQGDNRSASVDRRRAGDRRHRGRGDRRQLRQQAKTKALRDRRRVMDRRNQARISAAAAQIKTQDSPQQEPSSRKGRIIDERV